MKTSAVFVILSITLIVAGCENKQEPPPTTKEGRSTQEALPQTKPAQVVPSEQVVHNQASVQCLNQLKQIGRAFLIWAQDHNDRFPFNVSTNAGGTLELCARGNGGFDTNAAIHFQVLSNELSTTDILVCPLDSLKVPAGSFSDLRAAKVSYLLRSGTDIDLLHPDEVLVRCPIHGHATMCDGSVQKGLSNEPAKASPSPTPSEGFPTDFPTRPGQPVDLPVHRP